MTTARPKPQPATPRIAKVRDPHPATAATAPAAAQAHPSAAAAQEGAIVQFSVRIPVDLRQRLKWVAFSTGLPIQQIAIEALTRYVEQHPDPPPG